MSNYKLKSELYTEKEIQNQIMEYLRLQTGLLAFQINTVGIWDDGKKIYRRASKYVLKGTPDILICLKSGGLPIFVGLEVKRLSGYQSDEQKDFERQLKSRTGGFYFVVKSIDDTVHALRTVHEAVNRTLQK